MTTNLNVTEHNTLLLLHNINSSTVILSQHVHYKIYIYIYIYIAINIYTYFRVNMKSYDGCRVKRIYPGDPAGI